MNVQPETNKQIEKMKLHIITTLLLLVLIGVVIYILNSPFIMSIILLAALIYFGIWASIKVYKMIYQMVKNFTS
jgi:energy-coupling factor transporter transmembrane protein EcfT